MTFKLNKQVFALTTFCTVAIIVLLSSIATADLTANLPITPYAAKKVIDIISAASNIYAVIGIVAAVAGGGVLGIGVLFTAKALAKKFGNAYAAAW